MQGRYSDRREAGGCSATAWNGARGARTSSCWPFREGVFRWLSAVGLWYRDFPQIGDEEVRELLDEAQSFGRKA